MTPKHTPAPWVLSGRQVYSGKLDDDNFMDAIFIASVSDRNKNDAELIARAPLLLEENKQKQEIIDMLLEALQNLVSETTDGLGYEYNDGEFEALDKARAAIAQVTT